MAVLMVTSSNQNIYGHMEIDQYLNPDPFLLHNEVILKWIFSSKIIDFGPRLTPGAFHFRDQQNHHHF